MRFVDIIEKKKQGEALSEEEIQFFIRGYVANEIPDYQVSALLMAICFQGMSIDEITALTTAMLHSGDVIDLSSIDGIKIDKHSTGGVGDKTSLSLMPMVAACHAKVAKMSGRGLGHTGGTLDKLESISGFQIGLSEAEFIKQVNEIGIALIGQTGEVVPADKKLYALRDVTATVNSIPLIASSIMSKKLAAGSDTILLDVKYGEGAFMPDSASAEELASTMISIGKKLGKDTRALISNMNQPLGDAIGNALEVKEAIATLKGEGPSDFMELCLGAGSVILEQAKLADNQEAARAMLLKTIEDGSALAKLREMVEWQHGDVNQIDHPETLPAAAMTIEIKSREAGYVHDVKALELGNLAMRLGAGRMVKEDPVDPAVGIVLSKKVGDKVSLDEPLAVIHSNQTLTPDWIEDFYQTFVINEKEAKPVSLIEKIL
ncbi:MAG: pyrimidine-nucleoside phosphorylase [Erysipelotrichaceae bacterium]|uniref:Pyrimidine-nucleoside phosphorylase n=1 Tax=Copranaerobaculum intestinale TaxID=2692629 RepID=A0A6N8U7T5_9FIRM|nr:pyrimidine-nucleoside phosphorylase [Copranaerobaculum intestinale]MBS6373622.1 pyrimidine-nucleoside phosphorylase [Erysipelotrichaceae bacterium]MXQ73921.1 pyrimidine-nucleoside phosphorylase [Copranaerobaculum intestinale]